MSAASAGSDLAHRAPDVVDGRHAVDLGQRVVDADVAEVGVEEALADRRRVDEGIEQRLGLARVAFPGARLAVQARVVEGEGGAPCHLPHEGDVVLVVARVPAGARERDGPQHVPAGAQRHHQHRRQGERADQLEVLGVPRARDHLLLGDLGQQQRLAGSDDLRGTAAGARAGRVALAHPLGELDLDGVDVRDRDVAQFAVGVREIDRAPVAEVAHAQLGDRGQRVVHVERCVERGAHVGQEAHARQRGALVIDLARDADDRRCALRDRAPGASAPRSQCVLASGHTTRRSRVLVVASCAVASDRRPQVGAVVGMHAPEEGLEGRGRLAGAGERRHRARTSARPRWPRRDGRRRRRQRRARAPARRRSDRALHRWCRSPSCSQPARRGYLRRTPGIAGVPGPMARSVQRRTATARPARAGRARRGGSTARGRRPGAPGGCARRASPTRPRARGAGGR